MRKMLLSFGSLSPVTTCADAIKLIPYGSRLERTKIARVVTNGRNESTGRHDIFQFYRR